MRKARLFLAAALIFIATWFTATNTFAFDIAIYGDPLSEQNYRYLASRRYGWDTTNIFVNTETLMDCVYTMYAGMDVTHVMVIYPFQSNFNHVMADCTHFKLMNWYYPGLGTMHGEKYVDAQFRDVEVGIDGGPWSLDSSIRNPAVRAPHTEPGGPTPNQRQVVAIGLGINGGNGSADTLWRATSELGAFSGWDWAQTGWLDSSFNMPMHYRLTWAVDPNGSITISTPLATFYWIVKIPDERLWEFPDGSRWWRYPAKTITLDRPNGNGLADTLTWNTSEFTEDAVSGLYYALDENFASVDSGPWDWIFYGPARVPHSLDEGSMQDVSWLSRSDVRMSVRYLGTHSFYLNRVEVYDEGAWRMFASPDSSDWEDSIIVAFQNEYDYAGARLGGWYYDEWDLSGGGNGDPVLRSIVKVNKILQSANPPLPTFFINGYSGELSDTTTNSNWARNRFYAEEDRQVVEIPVQMNEFYFLGAATYCQPGPNQACGWPTPLHMWTSYASDTTYYIHAVQCGTLPCGQLRYEGYKSLQCAIDGSIWDWEPVFALGNIQMPPNMTELPHWFNLRHQVELRDWRRAHNHPDKFWALLCASEDAPNDSDGCCPVREPQPNEVKLMAWLAVACDVDGIMWYPWGGGGLWHLDVPGGNQFTVSDNYSAAKDVCSEIRHIAPLLDSPDLEFVKTYASRAFETDYPDSAYAATQRDVLVSNTSWFGNPYRSVEAILAYPPSGNGWSGTPDQHAYVQISRFRNRILDSTDASADDYWFLIVNRRALETERRKIRMVVEIDSSHLNHPFYINYILGDSTKSASPCEGDIPTCAVRYIDVVLDPGEAQLVHFYRGDFGCDSTYAHITELTAYHEGENAVRLRWEQVIETDMGEPFNVDSYFICGSPRAQGPFAPFAVTTDTTYVDSAFTVEGRYFYMVQACGTIPDSDEKRAPETYLTHPPHVHTSR